MEQLGEYVRLTHGSAILISIAFVFGGILLGMVAGFFIGREWQKRKDPETEEKYQRAIRESGLKSCMIHDLNVFIKAVEMAKSNLDETMRSKK